MRVLLDTNILLDFLLAREPFASDAREIWVACEQGRCTGYLAAISVTNIWYIGRKSIGMDAARQYIADLLRVIQVCPVDFNVLIAARDSGIRDYEDAVQAAAAVAAGLDAIVTRNGRDFASSPLPILTPAECLAQVSATTSTGASTAEEPVANNESDAWDVEL